MTHPQIGRALRLMNMEKNGTPTVAEFQALLTDAGRLDACIGLLQRPGAAGQIAGYPALYQALGSSAALQDMALTDAAAMKLVASIPAAMTGFIASQSALSAIADNAAVRAEFIASTALAAASVPAMTSNTAPSGIASASSEAAYAGWYLAFQSFDGLPSDDFAWYSDSIVADQWLGYAFPSAAFIHTVEISNSAIGNAVKDIRIEHSDDGLDFYSVKSIAVNPVGDTVIQIAAPGFHKHWRVFVESTVGDTYPSIKALNFKGFLQP